MTIAERIADLDAQIAAHAQAEQESWERSDTDGFLSQWASDLSRRCLILEKEIVLNGGLAKFVGLFTKAGDRVPAKMITTAHPRGWGEQDVWMLTPAAASVVGRKFIPVGAGSRIQKQLGLMECTELAPAEAVIEGRGKGLSGQCWIAAQRTGNEWGMDAVRVEL